MPMEFWKSRQKIKEPEKNSKFAEELWKIFRDTQFIPPTLFTYN